MSTHAAATETSAMRRCGDIPRRLKPAYPPAVQTCPTCGRENAEDSRFCSACGTQLLEGAAAREERKVVTCLFCDLVGFTARAEAMDPEDVRRLLQPYHARVRRELERFGGTVEKFIGDAVMAVFGAPVAHEDDPERAVRAALSIRDALADEGELEVRIGITTGEALVSLNARPDAGEGMASGDVVNTAARLQSAAPTGTILVDETTYRATERAIEFEAAGAVDAKGKSEPITAWTSVRARARVSVERSGGAELVGRDQELTLLGETLARIVREREPQLVTLVGVPGIGKSRLVFELFQTIETGRHGLVYWRHGRSLPYGEGVTLWALGEMVKAQAGIFESDGPEQAGEKLRQAVERFVSDPSDAAWVERHLRPLAGLAGDEPSGDRRDEAFAARRRFLEAIADERPLVLVFEDLHWADDALLDFVEYLVDWAGGVPLLVLCTARPELLVRRPGWGGGKVNSSTLLLSPLSDEETAMLVHALLGRSAVDADLQARLLEHAGGNPLYAEEFTRMLTSRPDDVVLPETVQGIIAARLDTLPADEKELLQHAAVIGRVFWLGALGRERWTLEERLHSLGRKEFVTRNRRTSVAGEDEYAFRHALVRDVAYEQIPRGRRADKHLAAAEWIESLGRMEDHAEMLAHHYLQALELRRATGQSVAEVSERARDVLVEAGDRAASLNSFEAAVHFYDEALALGGLDDREEAELRFRRAKALHLDGADDAKSALEEAFEPLRAVGEQEQAAEVDALLAEQWWLSGDSARSTEHLDRAHAAVDALPASAGKTRVLSQVARYRMLAARYEDALRIGTDALAMAESLGLDELHAHALDNIGVTKMYVGDRSGLEDIERSIELALAARSPEAARGYNNLAACFGMLGDVRRTIGLIDEALATGERLGAATARFSRTFRLWALFRMGAWDEALPPANEFLAACEAGNTHYHEAGIRMCRAFTSLARDDVDAALDDVRRALPLARKARDPQNVLPVLTGAAGVLGEVGVLAEAREAAHDALAYPASVGLGHAPVDFVWVADELGYAEHMVAWLAGSVETRWAEAARAVLRRDFGAAVALFDRIGIQPEVARARLEAAKQLAAEGRRAEADEELQRALAFWRSVGASRYIREGEALLGEASEIPA
jgi:class 3 adenylate cyclase/tetratricopeptide (TPR) repeat protein